MGAESIVKDKQKSKNFFKEKIRKLQSSLELKNEFFNSVPYLITIVKIDGTILDVNNAMANSLKQKRTNLIGSNILGFFPKEVAYQRMIHAQKAVETGEEVYFIDFRNGRFFKSHYIPIVEKDGNIEKIIAIVQDITSEKMNEKQRLLNQKSYFESLIENSLDIISVVNKEGNIIYESPSLKKILYFTPKERKNKSIFENIHPDDIKRVTQYFKKIISKPGLTKKISYRIKDKEEHWHYFESIGNNQLENKKIKGLIINSRDITNRVIEQMEKNAILDNTSEIIAYHDKNHNIVWANKAYQKETGLSLEELVGKKCYHAWGLDSACSHCPLSKALKTGKTVEAVFSPKTQNQWPSYFKTWKIIGDPVIDDYGNIIGAIEISYDITKEIKANEEIKRSKEHLERLIHNTSEIIFSINNEYKITLWNKTAENVTGIKTQKIIGKDIRKQQFIEHSQRVNNFLNQLFQHEPVSLKKMMIKTLFGSSRILQVSTSFVEDEEGRITDVIFICNDITLQNKEYGTLIPGVSYLINDDKPDTLIELINSTVSTDQKGLFITRTSIKNYLQILNIDDITFLLFSDKSEELAPSIHGLEKLKQSIHHFVKTHPNSIICLDRSDYLFTTFGFKDSMKTLYDINDLIKNNHAILLLRVNDKLITENQHEILKEEYASLPSQKTQHIHLDDKLIAVLRFIFEQNRANKLIYQKGITQHFSISKVTAQKRIQELIDNDLIFYKKRGRIKSLLITEKGKQILHKQT